MTNMVLVIVLTLMSEARGETYAGRQAVASVIWNRAQEGHKSFDTVCLARKQFSYWNTRKPSAALAAEWKAKYPAQYDDCVALAESMVAGTFKPTVTATHFYNPRLARPSWGRKMVSVTVIGNHRFGRV